MYIAEVGAFLTDLKANNNKGWFDANRPVYDALRSKFIDLVDDVIAASRVFDPQVSGLSGKSAVFRINRDIRFSKDKNPYKTEFSALLSPARKSDGNRLGYYFGIDGAGALFIGSGLYDPPAPILGLVRNAIDTHGDRLVAILCDPRLQEAFGGLYGDPSAVMPRGYTADHRYGAYLRYKSFCLARSEPGGAIADIDLADHIADLFKISYPLVQFLRDAVQG